MTEENQGTGFVSKSSVHGQANSGKQDQASDPKYDTNTYKQRSDAEIALRRRNGRWMSAIAVGIMGCFVISFFSLAIYFACQFFTIYVSHVHTVMDQGEAEGVSRVLPLVVPMMPAFFFSLLGLVTLVTVSRFITAYVNAVFDDEDDANLVERIAREVAGIIKAWKSGGS